MLITKHAFVHMFYLNSGVPLFVLMGGQFKGVSRQDAEQALFLHTL